MLGERHIYGWRYVDNGKNEQQFNTQTQKSTQKHSHKTQRCCAHAFQTCRKRQMIKRKNDRKLAPTTKTNATKIQQSKLWNDK